MNGEHPNTTDVRSTEPKTVPAQGSLRSPGPWELDWTIAGGGQNEDYPELHYVNIHSAKYDQVAPYGLSITGYVRPADAHLISAAPDLLDQLRKVRDWMDDPVQNMQCPFGVELASAIRLAVAKATGEQT